MELPDRRVLDCLVDVSIKTFNAVIQLCKELGKIHIFTMDHPIVFEVLSFLDLYQKSVLVTEGDVDVKYHYHHQLSSKRE